MLAHLWNITGRGSICCRRANVLLELYQTRPPSMTASSPAMTGPELGTRATFKAHTVQKQRYLRTEIGALDAQLNTGRTLQLGVPAAAFCLTLPSSLGARHAVVGRVLPASDAARRMRAAGRHIAQFGPMNRNFSYFHRFVRWRPPNRWVLVYSNIFTASALPGRPSGVTGVTDTTFILSALTSFKFALFCHGWRVSEECWWMEN